jgi:hypothetical protein
VRVTDFDFTKDLSFDPKTGYTTFGGSRVLIYDANAIGLLRQNLIEQLGWDKARYFFLRLGFQNGYSDFLQMKVNYTFDTEMDLLASGPVIHTWEGIVHAAPKEMAFDRAKGTFFFTGVWSNSFEAEQHLSHNHNANEPVCWSVMGYATGWCTAFFGKPVIAIEPVCRGKGDACCEWKIQPPEAWGAEAKVYLEAYASLLQEVGRHG